MKKYECQIIKNCMEQNNPAKLPTFTIDMSCNKEVKWK